MHTCPLAHHNTAVWSHIINKKQHFLVDVIVKDLFLVCQCLVLSWKKTVVII